MSIQYSQQNLSTALPDGAVSGSLREATFGFTNAGFYDKSITSKRSARSTRSPLSHSFFSPGERPAVGAVG